MTEKWVTWRERAIKIWRREEEDSKELNVVLKKVKRNDFKGALNKWKHEGAKEKIGGEKISQKAWKVIINVWTESVSQSL